MVYTYTNSFDVVTIILLAIPLEFHNACQKSPIMCEKSPITSRNKVMDSTLTCTGWRRPIGFLKLQVIFRKRATNYRALLRKMTYEDKASYGSSPHPVVHACWMVLFVWCRGSGRCIYILALIKLSCVLKTAVYSKEPYNHQKEPYLHAKEPCVYIPSLTEQNWDVNRAQ